MIIPVKIAQPSIVASTKTDLNIDGSVSLAFNITLSANAAFTLSNIAIGQIYMFIIKNTGASAITITLPNTADVKASTTITIDPGKTKELSLFYTGTTRFWQISESLT